jgi:hypothetical protein
MFDRNGWTTLAAVVMGILIIAGVTAIFLRRIGVL